jgi:hypothetical protein
VFGIPGGFLALLRGLDHELMLIRMCV